MTAPSQPPPAGTPGLSMSRSGSPPPGATSESSFPPGTPPPGTSRTRWRLPRRTVRLKLTLLYGGLFLASGAALLAVTYVLVSRRLPVAISTQGQTTAGGAVKEFCALNGTGGSGTATLPDNGCASLLATANQERNAALNQLLEESGIALAIMTVVSIGLGWLVAGRVLRPLRTMTSAARRISARNLHQRLALDGPDDELSELGKTFNGLLARLERSFAAQRQFVANASHELRTPLARQRTLVEVALRDPSPTVGSLQAVCERVLATGEEQERLIETLLTLARSQRGLDRCEPLDLAAVAEVAAAASEAGAQSRGLRVHSALAEAPALGDLRLAERLVANLVDNAVRHNVPGGWIEVVTGLREGRALLSVANTGPAIPPEKVDLLFQPFGRLEDRVGRDGLGLGLSIVTAIAAAHEADLRARPLPGGGLEVEVHFPRLPAGEPPEPAPTGAHGARGSAGAAGALKAAARQT
jgi:signal transduction histidine kinase